ncbi:MAG: molybdopterin-dependent oxidoreductase [Planctomycetes bacterium]|nr:molybdopterin-dependent oxidoreductase [Planctomycetota bacterium]
MPYKPKRGLIERAAVKLGVVPNTDVDANPSLPDVAALSPYASPAQWDNFAEFDAATWPRRATERRYRLVPTVCFNCESGCGLLAYVDKETNTIRKFEGNPLHPGSRGRNCAKGPATINQVNDPDRILAPMKRVGPRGDGGWQEVSWEEALADIAGRIRTALAENRHDEVVYHVGRPGSEGFIDRVLRAWGVDGYNSHTNICSSGARFGYNLWSGYDRPSPDYANARFVLALNAHLESGHYFNPHAQRISEGLARGAKMAVVDPRLSNTASMAHYWMPTRPGTEAALLLAFACVILNEELIDRAFIERWTNWREYMAICHADQAQTVDGFLATLKEEYAEFTPEYAAAECGVSVEQVREVARLIGEAGSRFCSHTWRGAAAAHLGGWQVSRCLFFLHVLTGSVGTEGGTSPSAWHKYKADLINPPPPTNQWNEMHWPREYPLAYHEMSFLLPHFLKEGRGKLDVYFTRVFNPVWTYPDGFSWIEVLRDESKIGLHVALTPTWNETAFYADYVLPMGLGPERHDLTTYETHSATWIAFRQPVLREARRADGQAVTDTRDANPGSVWEEDEFWIALCWAIDPDGSLGIRKYFESPTDSDKPLTVEEYYSYAFDHVPGLREAAHAEQLDPLAYMRKYGTFQIKDATYQCHERVLSADELHGATIDPDTHLATINGQPVGIEIDGTVIEGFRTPSRLLEFYSPTMIEWGWPEHTIPGYIVSHINERTSTNEPRTSVRADSVHPTALNHLEGNPPSDQHDRTFCLLPTFRLPTLIHTRSGSAKWLNEISQQNPIWIHTSDAAQWNLRTGDLVRITTDIGYFVDRAWVTESIRPGVVACSHHLGRWRRDSDPPSSRWSSSVVSVEELGDGKWKMTTRRGPEPFDSDDPDSRRIWWRDGGVPQNLTFPVHPDPISGMHCWHQRVRVAPASKDDRSGDVVVDTTRSMAIYREWLNRTRPTPQTGQSLRRPLWFARPLRPTDAAYRL